MQRVTGERFDHLMQRLVLRPLLLDACFNWSGCSASVAVPRSGTLPRHGRSCERRSAWLAAALPGGPARDGSCDLSAYVVGSNGLGEDGTASGFFCGYGLAVQAIGAGGPGCHDYLFGDGRIRLAHAGDAYGLKSGLWIDPQTGKGLAFFTTAVADDGPKGRSAFTATEESIVERSAR